MRFELSSFVEADLEIIADFIAQNSPIRAATFIQEIRTKIRSIAKRPRIYRLRPEIGEATRVAVHGNYLILFRIDGKVVRIERVVYGGRDFSSLFD